MVMALCTLLPLASSSYKQDLFVFSVYLSVCLHCLPVCLSVSVSLSVFTVCLVLVFICQLVFSICLFVFSVSLSFPSVFTVCCLSVCL